MAQSFYGTKFSMAQSFYGTKFLSASAILHYQRNPEKHRGLVDSNLHTRKGNNTYHP